MKTTGVSSIPKFGLLDFLGHPSDEGKLSQLLRTLCNVEELRKQVDTIRQLFHLNVSDDAEQELVTEQIKSIVSELQQSELDTDTPLDCKKCG